MQLTSARLPAQSPVLRPIRIVEIEIIQQFSRLTCQRSRNVDLHNAEGTLKQAVHPGNGFSRQMYRYSRVFQVRTDDLRADDPLDLCDTDWTDAIAVAAGAFSDHIWLCSKQPA
jgi:hypothetical protein